METKPARLSLTMGCLLICGMGLLGADFARAATAYNFNVSAGNWNSSANWTPVGVPGSADSVNINQGADVTVNDTEAANSLQIGNNGSPSGTLTVAAGANFTVGTGGLLFGTKDNVGASGSLVMTGGTFTSSSSLFIGFGAGSTGSFQMSGGAFTAANGTSMAIGGKAGSVGTMTQSGGTVSTLGLTVGIAGGGASSYSISGGTLNWSGLTNLASGSYKVMGSTALVSYSGSFTSTTTSFSAAAGTTVSFVFDAAGVSAINLNNTRLAITSGSLLTIDGSSYAGGSSDITLFSGIGNYLNGINTDFSASITGFGPNYTEHLVYNANSIVLQVTQVPEPGTVALLLAGAGIVLLASRRRIVAVG